VPAHKRWGRAAVGAHSRSFNLAPMSTAIRVLTLVLLAVPVLFLVLAFNGAPVLLVPGALVLLIYIWVLLRFRPTHFIVHPDALELRWPLKRRRIRRADIASVRTLDRHALLDVTGFCVRVGAGGLWGGFGWLWTQRRGVVQMYISRTDGFVWIERTAARPLLLTPTQPEAFARALGTGTQPDAATGGRSSR
jgi:Bacterial PH domain